MRGHPAAHKRGRSHRRAASLVPGLAGLLILLAACGDDMSSDAGDSGSPSPTEAANIEAAGTPAKPPYLMPDVTLLDQDGEPIRLREQVQSGITLLYVAFTHCADICPTHLATAAAIEQLPPGVRGQVKVIVASIDPARDTPAVLKAYLALFGEEFIGVTGTEEQMIAFQEELGIPVAEQIADASAPDRVGQLVGDGDGEVGVAART